MSDIGRIPRRVGESRYSLVCAVANHQGYTFGGKNWHREKDERGKYEGEAPPPHGRLQ
jgi:hypothetical protein